MIDVDDILKDIEEYVNEVHMGLDIPPYPFTVSDSFEDGTMVHVVSDNMKRKYLIVALGNGHVMTFKYDKNGCLLRPDR